MSYVYLGYGTTNSDGIAKLDHDANGDKIQHSYTGVGAGEIDVVASLDNPVSSGSIVSKTFVVSDCIFYDKGTLSDNHHWYNNDDLKSPVTRKEEYTEILYSSAYNRFQLTDKLNNNKVVFEFKTYESNNTDDYVIIQFDSGQNAIPFENLGITSTSDVRMEIEGNTLNAYTNGVKKLNNYPLKESISNGHLRLAVNPNSDGIRVSDIKVYPI